MTKTHYLTEEKFDAIMDAISEEMPQGDFAFLIAFLINKHSQPEKIPEVLAEVIADLSALLHEQACDCDNCVAERNSLH